MKKLLTALFVFGAIFSGHSQFRVQAGATVSLNNGATLVLQDTDLINEGTLNTSGTAKISFTGTTSNTMEAGGASITNVEVNKSSGSDLNVTEAVTITNALTFAGNNNKINLDAANMNLGTSATIVGADSEDFIVTPSTGELVKESMGTFTFPVGFSGSTYNPIALVESGAADNIGVRVLENAYDDGTSSGTQLTTQVVDATWVVSEAVAGGSDLAATVDWAASDEQGDFVRAESGIARYDGTAYDLTLANIGAATGSDPYTQTRASITPGSFIVGGEEIFDKVKVSPMALLEGPNVGGLMNDGLRSLSVIPATEPYTGLGFMHEGLGGGEVIADPVTVFGVTGNDAIVDWVFIELRSSADATNVLATRSALLQRDGDIVDVDGVSELEFKGFADGDYYVAVRHRLHLGFRTLAAKSLNRTTTTSLDFISGAEATFGVDALKDLSGTFVMYSGNGNYDSTVNSIDNTQYWLLQNGQTYDYISSSADFTMDGTVNSIDKVQHWRLNNGTIEQLD